ncbi:MULTISPECIES: hypothetical protein [Chryseobacterium]|jgi:hypothetical protein|uniref:Uncharacterized protein n=1 Tax=Chryseobacterium lathyri TaxID=395933 RepID=A0A511YBA3_9FLAO|nr:hypothetical protein [Chryseobacterium lathyri]GEN72488.1 hypothetical protein CLA01_25600 [Chryseobacterium lathyri]
MILIDYLYYQITNFYLHYEKDGTHKASGIIGACSLISFNLIFILMFLDHFYNKNTIPSNKYIIIIYCLPIILLVGLRYWKFTSYEQIREKVKGFDKTTRIIADILLIIYIIISFFGLFIFSLYTGSLKH